MKLKILSKPELAQLYEGEMHRAFPPSELKPLHTMERRRDAGYYEPLGVFDGEELVAYALMWLAPGVPYVLLDYLGTMEEKRGTGIGTTVLALLGQRYAHTMGVIGETEAVTAQEPEEAELQRRRLDFYERNGFVTVGYDCALFGVHYRTILLTDKPVDPERVKAAHAAIYRSDMPPEVYERYIQIPLEAGERPGPLERWTEE